MNDAQSAVCFAAIIPAYRPDERLLELLAGLSEKSVPAIVLVDDGSGPAYREIFALAAAFPKVRLVRHAVNLGKGAALKSGFNFALCAFPNLQGVITADADGQHHPDDIERVAAHLAQHPDRLVLGTRTFSGDVPLRSQIGNVVTRLVMRALVGQNLSDTQTGLRGIPVTLLPHLLRTEANGYDFELDMLIAVRQHSFQVDETPIRTIYEPGNRTSHFNPLIDSMKIYFVLLRFSSVSLMTAALDSLVFYIMYRRIGNLALSQLLGRVLAVAFNYTMVRRSVFFTNLRHAAVLPKYLLLTCFSGLASYAGIQFLTSHFHVFPLPAKLIVESLLFFANFAIQRDFIFGKSSPVAGTPRAEEPLLHRLPAWVPPAVLGSAGIALLCVTAYGFYAAGWLPDAGWTPTGRRRLLHYVWSYAAFAGAILVFAPSFFVPLVAGILLVATAIAIGPTALLAAALFLISSCALGSLLMGRRRDRSPESQLCATLLGMAIYIFLMNFLARLPVNYAVVYAGLLATPVLLDLRGTGWRLVGWCRALVESRSRARPQVAAFALLTFVIGMHWFAMLRPESGSDGLAMHLAIPHNIALHHILTYRPDRILWSVMPMGADWCYTLVYLLGGEFAARLLNFAMLLLVEAMLYCIVRRFVSPAISFLVLALFASTSVVQMVTGSLLVENFLAAVVMATLLAIWRFGDTAERRFLYAAAVLGGTALEIKLGGLAYLLVVLPVAIVEARRRRKGLGARPVLTACLAIVLLLAVALPPYIIAWRMTGSPIFPFLNQRFPSPLLDRAAVFTDYRFTQPLTWHTPFDLIFYSSRYYEGRPGSLGFQHLLLVPLGFLALIFVRRRPALGAAWASLGGAAIILIFLPNARYLYPSMPLLLVPLAVLLSWVAPRSLRRVLVALAVACVMLNAWYLPSSNFQHGDFYGRSPLSTAMRQTYIHSNAPMREIGQYMDREHPGAPILLTNSSELAAFNAEVYSLGWHQYGVWTRLRLARNPQEVASILEHWGVNYVAAPKPGLGVNIQPPALNDLLRRCSTPEYQSTAFYLAHLEKGCQAPQERHPLLVMPGYYDDFDPAIVYRGGWEQDKVWPQTFAHTVTYTNLPGSDVQFAFQGDVLSYVYTKASNRGMAGITIDGVYKTTVDFYSNKTQWQARSMFGGLGRRPHLAVITVLPDKNPKSLGNFVDVDAFQVQ